MLTRRDINLGLICAAGAGIASPAVAADPSARAFVTAIYDAYKGAHGDGIALGTDEQLRRYFEPALAAAIRADQKESERRNEVGALDFDPFVDAQDWEIGAYAIELADTAPGKARATVKFTNTDKPNVVALDLVKIGNEWKIYNVTWQRDGKAETLRQLFAL